MIDRPVLGRLDEYIDSDKNETINDSKLCEFLPTQVQLISKQRMDLCGCDIIFYKNHHKLL